MQEKFTRGIHIKRELHSKVLKLLIKTGKFKSFSSFVTHLIKEYFKVK